MKIFNLLPAVLQNDVNKSLYENVFDKFISDDTAVSIAGTVGEGEDHKIPEFTEFRQFNQIQPQMVSRVGEQNQLTSFEDFMQVLSSWGVDLDKFDQWGKLDGFSFHPPFDVHKFNNYSEYYWLSETQPDYITIKNRYRQLTLYVRKMFVKYPRLEYYSKLAYSVQTPTHIQWVEDILPGFSKVYFEYMEYFTKDPSNIVYEGGWDNVEWDTEIHGNWDDVLDGIQVEYFNTNSVVIQGNVVEIFTYSNPFHFELVDSGDNDGSYSSVAAMYDEENNVTIVDVDRSLSTTQPVGKVLIGNFDFIEWDPEVYSEEFGWDAGTDNQVQPSDMLQHDDWSRDNMWVHVSDVPASVNLSNYHKAVMPIIEYDSYLELNQWVQIIHSWKYSVNGTDYNDSALSPSSDEINSHRRIEYPVNLLLNRIEISNSLATKVRTNQQLTIELVASGIFIYPTIINEYDNGITSVFETNYDFSEVDPSEIRVHSLRTSSLGDDWKGFNEHWIMKADYLFKPSEDKVDVSKSVTLPIQGVNSTIYELGISYKSYSHEIRVYVNGRRQYGNFIEGNVVGGEFVPALTIEDCTALKFDKGLGAGEIRIHYSNHVSEDDMMLNVPVKMENGDVISTNLLTYVKMEQLKTLKGQYPEFNRYDCKGNHLGTTTNVWRYVRISTNPVNDLVNDRVGAQFINDLVEYSGVKTFVKRREYFNDPKSLAGTWAYVQTYTPIKRGANWDLPGYFKYNPNHVDRRDYNFNYTLTHFNNVIDNQPVHWVDQIEPTRVLGTMREYNDNVDWLWNHIHVGLPSIPSIISYGRESYSRSIQSLKRIAQESITTDNIDLLDKLFNVTVDQFQKDNNLVKFNDSTGPIHNFPATPVTMGWVPRTAPKHVFVNNGFTVTHHDGHSSIIKLTDFEVVEILSRLKNEGVPVHSGFPDTATYTTGDLVCHGNKLYQLKPLVKSNNNPTYTIPVNTCWLNVTSGQMFIGTQAGNAPTVTSNVWNEINLSYIIAEVIVRVEQLLYEMGKDSVQDFVVPDEVYVKMNEFVRTSKLDPNITTDYDVNNPFTWNYKSVLPDARWYTNYERMFNTRYPHVEPWMIQGYRQQPAWWDETYRDYTGVRTWIPQMWINIRNGNIPYGRLYPNGQISSGVLGDVDYQGESMLPMVPIIPVNTSNSTNEFPLDSLLPPYFYTTNTLLAQTCRLLNVPVTTNLGSMPYMQGERGPLEDIWARSVYYVYDCISTLWQNDPIRRTSKWIGIQKVETDSKLKLNVDGKLLSYKQLPHHGDIIDGQIHQYNGLYQWLAHKLRFDNYDSDFIGYRDKRVYTDIKFTYPVSGFIDMTTANVIKKTTLNYNNNLTYSILVKESVITTSTPLTSLRCVVSNVGSSEIIGGLRIPSGKGDDWTYTFIASNPYLTEIELYEPSIVEDSTFNTVLNGNSVTWSVYGTTTNVVKYRLGTPISTVHSLFKGVQGVIAFINSYEKFILDKGFVVDHETDTINEGTSWGSNVYDFITSVYSGMGSSVVIPFLGTWSHVIPVVGTGTFNVLSQNGLKFKVGQTVQFSTTGRFPTPLNSNDVYVVSSVARNSIQLTKIDGTPLVVTNVGQGFLSLGVHRIEVATPISHFEFNPHGKAIKYEHDLGILAKIGTVEATETKLYDQYGDVIDSSSVQVTRSDSSTVIKIKPNVLNVKMKQPSTIGSIVPILKTFEHVIVFDNESVDGEIWFEPSLGSFINSMSLSGKVYRNGKFKPTVGGAFLSAGQLVSNVKSSAHTHSNMYDSVSTNNEQLNEYARNLIGFTTQPYMDNIGISDDTQLSFYQNSLREKGLTDSINKFVNSTSYVDAGVDEWWAYKVGSFGNANRQIYQDLSLSQTTKYGDVTILDLDSVVDVNPLYGSDNFRQQFKVEPNIVDLIRVVPTDRMIKLNAQFDSVDVFFDVDTVVTETYYRDSYTLNINNTLDAALYNMLVDFNDVTQSSDNYTVTGNILTFSKFTDIEGNDILPVRGNRVKLTFQPKRLQDVIHYETYPGAKYLLLNTTVIGHPIVIYVRSSKATPPLMVVSNDKVVDRVELWDPATGVHSNAPLEYVDHESLHDVAHYTDSLIPSDVRVERNWGEEYLGNIWWDTSYLFYKPYHETRLYNGDARVKAWGELCDFADVRLYEWVKSPVPPSEFYQYEITQGRISKPLQHVRYRTRDAVTGKFGNWKTDGIVVIECNGYEYTNRLVENSSIQVAPGTIHVYVNGISTQSVKVESETLIDVYSFNVVVLNQDIVHFVKMPHVPSIEELNFNPDIRDDKTKNVNYRLDTPYVHRISLNELNVPVHTYFFWATDTETKPGIGSLKRMSVKLKQNDNNFGFFSNVNEDGEYQTLTLIGVNDVREDYHIRLVKEDELESTQPLEYSQWKLIRQGENTNIPRHLWNRLIESMVGYKVDDEERTITNVPVPALDLVFWDQERNSSLRYGLGYKQSMCPMNVAHEVVNSVISDPTIDLYPVDRDVFRSAYNTLTLENTVKMMDAIYNTFTPRAVNSIWFKCLQGGLAENVNYEGIMKTSYIQVTSVQSISEVGS